MKNGVTRYPVVLKNLSTSQRHTILKKKKCDKKCMHGKGSQCLGQVLEWFVLVSVFFFFLIPQNLAFEQGCEEFLDPLKMLD